VSVVFLSIVFGMTAYKFKLWPFPIFRDAFQATKAWRERLMPVTRYNTYYSVNILLTGAGVQDLSWKRPKLKFGLQQVPVKTKVNRVLHLE